MRRIVIVFLGGGLGACGRAVLIQALGSSSRLPLPILVANLSGAFLLGVIYVFADEVELLRTEARLFLAVGVLGGFTTFSTFAWGTDLLLSQHHLVTACLYLGLSLGGGLGAVAVGLFAGRELALQIERAARHTLSRLEAGRVHRGVRDDMASLEAEPRKEPPREGRAS